MLILISEIRFLTSMAQNLSVKQIILKLNEKLLALSTRNKLLSSSFSTRSEAFFFIDEIPQKLAEKLTSGTMEFIPLPPLETESSDEKSKKFINQLSILKLTDDTYLNEIEKLQEKDIQDQDEIANLELKYERSLKDRLRSELSLPLDVHTGRIGRDLGLLTRKLNDHKSVKEIDLRLRELDPIDPVKYDYALFGLGVYENF